ncbi:MAG: right-handed parallel beta-helix repeat-containing protein [Saprospiraceae bacterium]|nr:right-handed parallel beta-helix repeat-containing protein [Saprospiraceae bacterium]
MCTGKQWFAALKILKTSFLAIISGNLLFFPFRTFAANATLPGSIDSYSTIHSIGIEWNITGDDDHDASCTVEYRKTGTTTYQAAKNLYRVDFQGYNTLAGSVFFLEPGTQYEVRLTLSDPDGGASTQTVSVSTRSVPVLPGGGRTLHVIPGNGGGDGSQANPFQGVDAAESIAQPGDVFLLHAGNYGGVIYFNAAGTLANHVVWKAAGDGDPVFEGIRLEADYIWLEGLKIINQQYGLRTSPPGPTGVVIKRCFFENNHYSIYLNDGGDGWYIADNTIVGDNIPKTSDFSGEGIELWHTSNHTICYNTISRVADGISYPHRNVDMFGNDIFDTSDDGIEFDYGHANNRAWKNRISNLFNNGISFQPMNGAPYYVLFNQVAVLNNQSVLKLRDRSDRALIAHNTFICNSGPMASGSNFLVNFEVKNNLWISIQDRYAWENGTNTSVNWKTDFDYDGFDWGNYTYAFKWGDRLNDIAEFHNLTGQESHGIRIDHPACFDTLGYAEVAGMPGEVDSFFLQYYTLKSTCNAIDAGMVLANINDGFVGTAPDLGAYEKGSILPHYGVRPDCDTHLVNSWIGPPQGDWFADPAYWSQNHFPENCEEVIIESGKSVLLHSGESTTVYQLEIKSGAQLQIDQGALLTVAIIP